MRYQTPMLLGLYGCRTEQLKAHSTQCRNYIMRPGGSRWVLTRRSANFSPNSTRTTRFRTVFPQWFRGSSMLSHTLGEGVRPPPSFYLVETYLRTSGGESDGV